MEDIQGKGSFDDVGRKGGWDDELYRTNGGYKIKKNKKIKLINTMGWGEVKKMQMVMIQGKTR